RECMTLPAKHPTASKGRGESSAGTPATIRLLLADVDGTLVTHEKVLTQRARDAVAKMRSGGIQFAITSGRPPRGMEMLIAPLDLTTPIAAFNGGMLLIQTCPSSNNVCCRWAWSSLRWRRCGSLDSTRGSIEARTGSCASATGHMSIAKNGR